MDQRMDQSAVLARGGVWIEVWINRLFLGVDPSVDHSPQIHVWSTGVGCMDQRMDQSAVPAGGIKACQCVDHSANPSGRRTRQHLQRPIGSIPYVQEVNVTTLGISHLPHAHGNTCAQTKPSALHEARSKQDAHPALAFHRYLGVPVRTGTIWGPGQANRGQAPMPRGL